jgi:hypothetical protein
MTDDERKRTMDSIVGVSDRLTELARRFDRLRWMAEKDSTDVFLKLTDAAGKMTESSLEQLSTLLDMLFTSQLKIEKDA